MQKNTENMKSWDECPSGLISRTAKPPTEPKLGRLDSFCRWAMGLCVVVIVTGVSYRLSHSVEQHPQQKYETVSCEFVYENLTAFCNDEIEDESIELAIWQHLNTCPGCRQLHSTVSRCDEQCPGRPRNVIIKPNVLTKY